MTKIYLAGDHNAGLHPQVLAALTKANEGKAPSYGEDKETQKVTQQFTDLLKKPAKVLLFSTGTAANIVGLTALIKPWQSFICAKTGHINTYEAGGPTRFAGVTLDSLPTQDGKITIDQIKSLLDRRPVESDIVQPKVVYLTQPTEMGTVYTKEELTKISEFCKSNHLYLFIDGARIANAISKLNLPLAELTTDLDVDALTWGGIKNGGLADALIFLNPQVAQEAGVDYIYKQIGQNAAKMRFYSATVNALLDNDLWLTNAGHANAMTGLLYNQIKNNQNIKFVVPVETNFIWSVIPPKMHEALSQSFEYYLETNELALDEYKNTPLFARWLTSWAATEEEVNALAQAINSFV